MIPVQDSGFVFQGSRYLRFKVSRLTWSAALASLGSYYTKRLSPQTEILPPNII